MDAIAVQPKLPRQCLLLQTAIETNCKELLTFLKLCMNIFCSIRLHCSYCGSSTIMYIYIDIRLWCFKLSINYSMQPHQDSWCLLQQFNQYVCIRLCMCPLNRNQLLLIVILQPHQYSWLLHQQLNQYVCIRLCMW